MTARALWCVGVALAASGCETCENDVKIPDSGLDARSPDPVDAAPVDAAPGLDGGDGDAAIADAGADAGADAAIADAAPPDAAPNSLCSDPVSVFNGSFEVPELAPGASDPDPEIFAWTVLNPPVSLVRPASGLPEVEPFAYPGHFSQALRFDESNGAISTELNVDVGVTYRLKFAAARLDDGSEGAGFIQGYLGSGAATSFQFPQVATAGEWYVFDTVTHTATATPTPLYFNFVAPPGGNRHVLIDSVCLEPI